MKKLICCTFALGFVLVLASASYARPSGEVKASPLFQQSLEQTIAKLQGSSGQSQPQQVAGVNLPTGQNACPMLPYTQSTTCSPTYCGSDCEPTMSGGTCTGTCSGGTCDNTCNVNQSTCQSTCQTTCQNTCANTCIPGPCTAYVQGTVYWEDINQTYYHNWDTNGSVWRSDWNFQDWNTTFRAYDGHYGPVACPNESFDLAASGEAGPFWQTVNGLAGKQAQPNGGTVTVDIHCGMVFY